MKLKIIVGLFILFTSCSCNNNISPLERYLQNLSEEINQDSLTKFKNQEIDKEGRTMHIVYKAVNKSINQLPEYDSVSRYLHSVLGNEETRTAFISLALHQYCRTRSYDVELIKREFYLMEGYKGNLRLREEYKVLRKKILKNDKKYAIGDTIYASFIVDNSFGSKRLVYKKRLSDSLYYSHKNMLDIVGIVKKKYYRNESTNFKNEGDLIFDCEILSVSDSNVFYGRDLKLQPGIIFGINLSYFRPTLGHY